jgi:formamidopyrimidine-DNA glycosylase
MPELPEVETIARTLKPALVGQTILAADLRWARTLATPSTRKFKEQIKGQQILGVSRRAKFLNFRLADFNLFVHLRMSGDLFIKEEKDAPEKHDRLRLSLSDGKRLVFRDARKFGRVWLTADPDSVIGGLGPEPLSEEFTPEWLFSALQDSATSIQTRPCTWRDCIRSPRRTR